MKKLSYEYIKSQFEKEGYTLLTKTYENCSQKLEFICPNNHIHAISWDEWKQGSKCYYCSVNVKKTIEEIREAFEAEGYTLLTEKYKNAHQKLDYICPNGHKHSISWANWQQGHRCGKCKKCAKKTIEEIREAFEKEGYTLLTKKYKNVSQKLKFICPNGHIHSIQWNNWRQGKRCGKCKIKYYSKDDLENFNIYKEAIYNLSNRLYNKYKSYINPLNLKRGKYSYHLDHIYSVIDGYENNIPVEIISNPNNLRLISAQENFSKNGNSYISRMMLYHLAII